MNCLKVTRRHQYILENGVRTVLRNIEPPLHVSLESHTIRRKHRTPAEREEREAARRIAAEQRQAKIVADQEAKIRQAAEQMAAQMVKRPQMVDKTCEVDFPDPVQVVLPTPIPVPIVTSKYLYNRQV